MVSWLFIGLQVKTKGKKAMFDKAVELGIKIALDLQSSLQKGDLKKLIIKKKTSFTTKAKNRYPLLVKTAYKNIIRTLWLFT
jgi:hypothetical protein